MSSSPENPVKTLMFHWIPVNFNSSFEIVTFATKCTLIALGAYTVTKGMVAFVKPVMGKFRKGSQNHIRICDRDKGDEKFKSSKEDDEERKRKEEVEMFNLRKPPEVWNTAFFFPDPDHDNPDVDIGESSTKKLLHLLDSAKLSIKLCMYLSSYNALQNKLVSKFKEGLIVQVVTCRETTEGHNNYQVKKYCHAGIPVRTKANSGNFMHHKFVVIDDEAVITGSLNWTRQGIAGNRENVLVTTDPRIVSQYSKEFATLWNAYEDFVEK